MNALHDFKEVDFHGHTGPTATLLAEKIEAAIAEEEAPASRRITRPVAEAIFRLKSNWAPHPGDVKALDGVTQADMDAYWDTVQTPPPVRRSTLSDAEMGEIDRVVVNLIQAADPALQSAVSRRISTTSDTYRRTSKNGSTDE